MKASAIAALSMAVLSVFICPIPAEAKREDAAITRPGITKLKSGLKTKVKQSVVRRKSERRKAALGGRPVAAKAAGKVARRLVDRSPKPAKPLVAKAAPKRRAASKTVALRPMPRPRVAAAKHTNPVFDPPIKRPQLAAPKLELKRPSESKMAPSKPKLEPPAKESARLSDGDGLPPFIRGHIGQYERARRTEAAAMIIAMAPCQQVPVWLALRVAMTESSLKREARGSAGEFGLFQIKCETARLLGFEGSCERLYDARTNIHWGLKHLSRALEFSDGDPRHAASKHNGGLGSKELRPEYVQRVMCSSARSGFPSAYQLGASADIQRMCTETQGSSIVGPYDNKNLLTSSITEIGAKAVAMVRTGVPSLAGNSCNLQEVEQSHVLPPQTGAKPQQVSPKPPSASTRVDIIGSLAPAYVR